MPRVKGDKLSWTNLNGGVFSEPSNWDPPQAPKDGDDVNFELSRGASSYFVQFKGGNRSANATIRNQSNPVFDLAAGGLDISGLLTIDGAFLTVSGGPLQNVLNVRSIAALGNSSPAPLTLTNGAIVTIGGSLGDTKNVLAVDIFAGSVLGVSGDAPRVNMTVDGLGSVFQASSDLSGIGLRIRNGAVVESASSVGNPGNVVVSTGGVWRVSGPLAVGVPDANGNSGNMTITSSGRVISQSGIIAQNPAFDNPLGQVSIDGDGSSWTVTNLLQVGRAADNQGTLRLSNGAMVSAGSLDVGITARARGLVDLRDGASFSTKGSMRLGVAGMGSFALSSGSRLTGPTEFLLGIEPLGSGVASVAGSNSFLSVQASLAEIGRQGSGSLTVQNGGQVETRGVAVATQAGGAGLVSISGAGTHWTALGSLIVGAGGTGRLEVQQGARLDLNGSEIQVGSGSGSEGSLILDGAASTLKFGGDVRLGVDGGTGTLLVTNGFKLGAARQVVVGTSGAGSAVAVIDGTNTTWQIEESLVVGQGAEGSFIINNSAVRIGSSDAVGLMDASPGAGASNLSHHLADSREVPASWNSRPSGFDSSGVQVSDSKKGTLFLRGPEGSLDTPFLRVGNAEVKDLPAAVQVEAGGHLKTGWLDITHNGTTTEAAVKIVDSGSFAEITGSNPLREGIGVSVAGKSTRFSVYGAGRAVVGQTMVAEDGKIEVLLKGELTCANLQLSGGSGRIDDPDLVIDTGGYLDVNSLLANLALERCNTVLLGSQGSVDIGVYIGARAAPGEIRVNALGRLTNDGVVVGVLTISVGGWVVGEGTVKGRAVNLGKLSVGRVRLINCGGSQPKSRLSLGPGTDEPGGATNAFGTFTINGDYEQAASGVLEIKIGGSTADLQYGVLQVTGNTTLGGKLSLQFIDGFAPKKGQSFAFLQFGTNIVGNFDTVEITGLAAGFQYQLSKTPAGTLSLVAQNDGIATSPPRLRFARVGTALQISWLDTTLGYTLETSSDAAARTWLTVPTTSNQFTAPISTPAQFFRLVKPGPTQ